MFKVNNKDIKRRLRLRLILNIFRTFLASVSIVDFHWVIICLERITSFTYAAGLSDWYGVPASSLSKMLLLLSLTYCNPLVFDTHV